MDNVDEALRLASHKWYVLPLCAPSANEAGRCSFDDGDCKGVYDDKLKSLRAHIGKEVGKVPMSGLAVMGFKGATTDVAAIQDWWSRYPLANVGVALAQSGLLVVDPDSVEAEADAKARGLPPTLVRLSRNPAFVYRRPEAAPVRNTTRQGASQKLDVLADGYLVVKGRHAAGVEIRLDGDISQVAVAPDWAVDLLRQAERGQLKKQRASVRVSVETTPVSSDGVIPLSVDRLDPRGARVWSGEDYKADPEGRVDRSATLQKLAFWGALAGGSEDEAAAMLAERDVALGYDKYVDRPEEYLRMAEKAMTFVRRDTDIQTTEVVCHEDDVPEAAWSHRLRVSTEIPPATGDPRDGRLGFIIPRDHAVIGIIGETSAGKTTFCFALARALCKGDEFLGMKTKSAMKVLYVDAETGEDMRAWIMDQQCIRDEKLAFYTLNGSLVREDVQGELIEDAKAWGADVIILDPISAVWPMHNEDDNSEANKQMEALLRIKREAAADVIYTHHSGKGNTKDKFKARGASSRVDRSDIVMNYDIDGDLRNLKVVKTRFGTLGKQVKIMLGKDGMLRLANPESVAEQNASVKPQQKPSAYKLVTEALQRRTTASVDDLARETGFVSGTVSNMLSKAKNNGQAQNVKNGVWEFVSQPPISTELGDNQPTVVVTHGGIEAPPSSSEPASLSRECVEVAGAAKGDSSRLTDMDDELVGYEPEDELIGYEPEDYEIVSAACKRGESLLEEWRMMPPLDADRLITLSVN